MKKGCVPVGPFRQIIADAIEKGWEQEDLSFLTGLSLRRLWGILNEQECVSFDIADRIVTYILGPMAWHEDEELRRIYESVDLNPIDWSDPVSEKVADELRSIAAKFVRELGTSAKAAEALGISARMVGRYARASA